MVHSHFLFRHRDFETRITVLSPFLLSKEDYPQFPTRRDFRRPKNLVDNVPPGVCEFISSLSSSFV